MNHALGNGSFYNIGPVFSGLPAVLSDQAASSGVENILISFSGSVTAFGLNYGTFVGSPVTFALSNGESFTTTASGKYGYGVRNFAGATDSTPFTSVLVTAPDSILENRMNSGKGYGGLQINNVSTGHAVLEPSSFALLGLGGFGLAFGAYLRRFTTV